VAEHTVEDLCQGVSDMKRIILILASMMLMMSMLASCSSSAVELPFEIPIEPTVQETVEPAMQETPQLYESESVPFEPTEDWEIALVGYLAQFTPMFHNVRFRDEPWGSWWESDWRDFVEELVDERSEEWRQMENRGYGYTFIFHDSLTGERVAIDDVPYLNQRSGAWYDEHGVLHTWSRTEISTHFGLFDLDDTGIPALVIYWNISQQATNPGMTVTLHRFRNGEFEFVTTLSTWGGVGFYRADDGRLFIEYGSTVSQWLDLHIFHLDDEITTEPVLTTIPSTILFIDGGITKVHNHLTGEYVEEDELWARFVWIDDDWSVSYEAFLGEVLGIPLTRIERMEVQEQLTEFIAEQLRADGRMR